MSNNVLITGISGFLGSHLAKHLVGEGYNVVGIVRDKIPSVWLNDALSGITEVHGDLRNKELVMRTISHYEINHVYHLAALAQVKHAWRSPASTYENNIMGTVSILEACRCINNDIKVLVFNTDKVYGEKLKAIETDRYCASEPYATSKVCQGFIAQSYIDTYKMNIKMSSCCNIFGYDPYNSRIVSNVVKSCIKGYQPVIYTNDSSIREYIYIEDVVDAIIRIMCDENMYDIYNISTGYVFNQQQVVSKIAELFNITCKYVEGDIPKQIQEQTMDSIHWNWKPKHTFREGLVETVDMFRKYKCDWDRNNRSIINALAEN